MRIRKGFLKAGTLLFLLCKSLFLYAQPAFQYWNTANSPLPDNSVRALVADNDNGIWVATDFGLARFYNSSWEVYQTSNSPLPENDIRSLVLEGDTLWIGTFSSGLIRKNGNNWTQYHTGNSGLPENHVRCIQIDQYGNKWIGTTGGLAKFNGQNWQTWTTLTSGFSSDNITSIHLAEDNSCYIGTVNGGLLHLSDTSLTVFKTHNSGIPDNTILALHKGANGKLLMGSPNAGLIILEQDSVFTNFSPLNSLNPVTTVSAIITDSLNTIYLGSSTSGMATYNGAGWQHFNLLSNPALAGNVQAFAIDNNGYLWLGTTNAGLVRLEEQVAGSGFAEEENQILVYPNPAKPTDELTIHTKFDGSAVTVVNAGMQLTQTTSVIDSTLDLSRLNLQEGMHFVFFQTQTGCYPVKLLILK